MSTAETSVTVTARVIGEVSSLATSTIATTTEAVTDPSFWQTIINFFTSIFS